MTEEKDSIIDDLLPEYDLDEFFKTSVRGKYAEQYKEGTNVVLLDSDVVKFFPNSEKVNEVLRLVIQMTNMQEKIPDIV